MHAWNWLKGLLSKRRHETTAREMTAHNLVVQANDACAPKQQIESARMARAALNALRAGMAADASGDEELAGAMFGCGEDLTVVKNQIANQTTTPPPVPSDSHASAGSKPEH